MTSLALIAHQGGWDEALFVAGPIAVVAALLWLAKRRVTRAAAAAAGPGSDPGDPGADSRQPTD